MTNTRYNLTSCGIILKNDKEIIQSLHRTQVTDTQRFDDLVVKIEKLRQEVDRFICEQENAGKLERFIVGGNSEGEIYPRIDL